MVGSSPSSLAQPWSLGCVHCFHTNTSWYAFTVDKCTGRARRRHSWVRKGPGAGEKGTWGRGCGRRCVWVGMWTGTRRTSLLIKYKDNPQTSTQGRKISLGTVDNYQQCFDTTRPSLEPLLGTRTSTKTFKLVPCMGLFLPKPPASLAFRAMWLVLHSPGQSWLLSIPTLINFDNPSLLPR